MTVGRLLLIALLALVLGGCWMGTGLYGALDARPAIPSGTYRATEPDGTAKTYHVRSLPNGLTEVDDGADKIPYGFAPLGSNAFVAWLEIDEGSPSGGNVPNQFYGLLLRLPNGAFSAFLPRCKGADATIAKKSGAAIGSGPAPECRFSTRAALERALRLYPHDGPGLKLTPVPR